MLHYNKNSDGIYFLASKARGLVPDKFTKYTGLQNISQFTRLGSRKTSRMVNISQFTCQPRYSGARKKKDNINFSLTLHESRNDSYNIHNLQIYAILQLRPNASGKEKTSFYTNLSMVIFSLAARTICVQSSYRRSLKKAASNQRSLSIIFSAKGDTTALCLSTFTLFFDVLR
jgi:hypothetical protein